MLFASKGGPDNEMELALGLAHFSIFVCAPLSMIALIAAMARPDGKWGFRLGLFTGIGGFVALLVVIQVFGPDLLALGWVLTLLPVVAGGLAALIQWLGANDTPLTPVTFPDRAAMERAAELLKGRFAGLNREATDHLLPEAAVQLLVEHRVPFTVASRRAAGPTE